ncbi:hypothetical protein FOA52_007044 [Chlamydomonas sp. UWO 241]|nr:hypothetical protein FOA52_007044 [Chlamydomonas sp. UWO 241]
MLPCVLVTGGSGYLGQFVITALKEAGFEVAYTYASKPLASAPEGVQAFQVDFKSGDGLDAAFASGPFVGVVNCAAVSQPGLCEKDEASARAVNVPSHLVGAMGRQREGGGGEALLLHLSTDQVYDGSHAMWTEDDAVEPVNAYGRSKVEAEEYIRAHWPAHVCLRSSIIYGPPAPGTQRPLFLQFVEGALRSGTPTSFFDDEFRSPVHVADICAVLAALLARPPPGPRTYNMGGPQRLSRADMACAVAAARGLPGDAIVAAPAASVQRGVASPADISMDSSRLAADTDVTPTLFADALARIPEWHPPAES